MRARFVSDFGRVSERCRAHAGYCDAELGGVQSRPSGRHRENWAAPGKRGREVERAEQGKGKERVGPEGFPGWATGLVWFFFLFSFLLFFFRLNSN